MGQGWSKFKFGHLADAYNNPPQPDAGVPPSLTLQQSQATTEASSSVPMYQGGPYSVSAADVEIDAKVVAFLERLLKFKTCICNNLSSLHEEQEWEEDEPQERGKEARMTPTPSTSQLSPPQAFLKAPEKAHLKKAAAATQASPSAAACKHFAPLKVFEHKPARAAPYKPAHDGGPPSPPLHAEPTRKHSAAAAAAATPSTSQFSPSQAPDKDKLAQMEEEDEDTPSQSVASEPDEVKMTEAAKEAAAAAAAEGLTQPHSSAQKLLMFELDRKRKAPAGLPSLAVECMGASRMKLKARTSLAIPSEGGSREAVLDLGTGDAMVGRCVKKAVGGRGFWEGRVSVYDAALRSYQIKYDNGKEEAMEWLDLEPCLVEQSKNASAPAEDGKGTQMLRKSLRNVPRFKKVDELVYTKRKSRGRRRKK